MTNLYIWFPEDFDAQYATYLAESKINTSIESKPGKEAPFTEVEIEFGYLILANGEKIKVGKSSNIPFKLLESLCPLGESKAIRKVFEESSSLRSKYKNSQASLPEQRKVIEGRIKDLQKLLRKKVKITADFDMKNGKMLLKYN